MFEDEAGFGMSTSWQHFSETMSFQYIIYLTTSLYTVQLDVSIV